MPFAFRFCWVGIFCGTEIWLLAVPVSSSWILEGSFEWPEGPAGGRSSCWLESQACLSWAQGAQSQSLAGGLPRAMNTMEALPACQLRDAAQEALGVAVIGIDEGQFFPDIVEFSEAMANAGKTVIVAALDGTFQRKAFGAILNLVPLAESVVKLTAVCMECFREAAYTKRLGTEKEVEVIGGADKYHSVCRLCYFKKPLGQPAGLDSTENKENCPVLGKPGEATGARKLFAPHQILQCSTAN
uniref:Thymidine kinase n=1 Tax=Equus asinus TaxID=9793 RepID=A0A9L0JV09_EQUAS